MIKRDLGVDVLDVPGAGAAGGLGAALIAFLGATLSSGAEVIGEAVHIDARVAQADIVITGEGRLDFQTVFGKTPQYVAKHAAAAGKRCICIAGQLGPGWEDARGLFADISAAERRLDRRYLRRKRPRGSSARRRCRPAAV